MLRDTTKTHILGNPCQQTARPFRIFTTHSELSRSKHMPECTNSATHAGMHKFRISVMLKTITRVMMTGTDLQSFQHPPCRSLRPAWKTRSYTSSSFTAKKHIVLAFDAGLGILPICVQLRQDTRARSHRIHGKALSVLKRSIFNKLSSSGNVVDRGSFRISHTQLIEPRPCCAGLRITSSCGANGPCPRCASVSTWM